MLTVGQFVIRQESEVPQDGMLTDADDDSVFGSVAGGAENRGEGAAVTEL